MDLNLPQQAAAYLSTGQYTEAIALYEQCIEAEPMVASHYWQIGLALLLQGEVLEAQAAWLSVLADTEDPQQVNELVAQLLRHLEGAANQRLRLGQFAAAEQIYSQILEQAPDYSAIAYINLSVALEHQGKLAEAIAACQQALVLDPQQAIAYMNLGVLLNQQGNLEGAIHCYRQAVALDPSNAVAYTNLGEALEKQGKLAEAITWHQQALALDPKNAMAHYNLGVALYEQGDLEPAIAAYTQAIELNPNYVKAHWNRSISLLLNGNLKRGFVEYEWRWQKEDTPPRPFSQPVWDGSNLNGKTILLHSEQGLGDTIHFIRYASLVAQQGGRVVVECQAPLMRLLQTVSGIDQLVTTESELPKFDVHAPLLSLPRIFETSLETIPAQVPYLSAPSASNFRLTPSPDTKLSVGLVWASQPGHPSTPKRSCPLPQLIQLLQTPGIQFYSLQKGPQVAEIAQYHCDVWLQDLDAQLQDFGDTAAVINQLDLVITVDTAVAHLAGALGRPVWILLAFVPDWRWLMQGDESLWYPSARLFRQQHPGEWTDVIARVAEALSGF